MESSDGTNTISYTYDADGLRTSKTVNGVEHTYYYAGGKLLRESFGSNTLDFFYDASGNAYALKYNGTLYYYITNLQGDVMSIVDAQGAVVASYEYDPYGNLISDEPAENTIGHLNPIRYRGYYYDSESELYYLQSRYYDPEIGRFLNADAFASTGQGLLGYNMFAYCHNNPVLYVDPSGNIIVLAPDATEEQTEEYEKAIAYLKTSETGRKLIEFLEASSAVITIVFVDDNNPKYNPANKTIYFDIDCGVVLGDGTSVVSPALTLAHEMGHAAQDIVGVIIAYKGNEVQIEALNLQATEIPIAKELGEPIRYNYNYICGTRDMQNSIHFITTHSRSFWQRFISWNWAKFETKDHNV